MGPQQRIIPPASGMRVKPWNCAGRSAPQGMSCFVQVPTSHLDWSSDRGKLRSLDRAARSRGLVLPVLLRVGGGIN